MSPSDPVRRLVESLRELFPQPHVGAVMELLGSSSISADQLLDRDQRQAPSPGLVSIWYDNQFELLVMTSLPGLGTSPHDQSGGMSAVRVIEGRGEEVTWSIGSDGLADEEFATPLRTGEVTGWHDSGIHSIRNPAGNRDPLVTLHVHIPPHAPQRRFVPRGAAADRPDSSWVYREPEDQAPAILVVGGGFSGTMTAVQLMRQTRDSDVPLKVILTERSGSVGEGVAYATRDERHLLNVPAGRMSALPDRPEDYLEWARRRDPRVGAGDYLPRRWYGEYVREMLFAEAASSPPRLQVVADEVRRLTRHPGGGWMAHFDKRPSMRAAAAVIAIGHRDPPDLLADIWQGPRHRMLGNPWSPALGRSILPAHEVVILGTGLTAIDCVLSLTRGRRQGRITLVSRNGLLPQGHADSPVTAADLQPLIYDWIDSSPRRLTGLLHAFREFLARHQSRGGDWRSAVDGLRPHMAAIWQALDLDQRQQFMRHLRPLWEVHRHRMAPQIAATIRNLIDEGTLRIVRGKVRAAKAIGDRIHLSVQPRHEERSVELSADWLVNCVGPQASNSPSAGPLIASLLASGIIRADALRLGLDTSPAGEAISSEGESAPDLLIVGTLRKPANWESTAVPELRVQARDAASLLVERMAHWSRPA